MVRLKVNGVDRSFDGDPEMPLLWYLCHELKLTGTLRAVSLSTL